MVKKKETAWAVLLGMWQARTENDPFKDCNIYFRMDMDSEKQPFSEPQELEMEQEWYFLGASSHLLRRY